MPTLDAILDHTRTRLPALRGRIADLERAAAACPQPQDFGAALRGPRVALIAEIKRRSPSVGAINEILDPVLLAGEYAAGRAAAISVLTEQEFFGGTVADLRLVSATAGVPVLRKDFILDETQLLEARAEGAAAALLIVRALDQPVLRRLVQFAIDLQLTPLIETHHAGEIARALEAGGTVIGVNSRDLDNFSIDTAAAWRLLAQIPRDCLAVAESGMATVADVAAAAAAGADAVLIGSALARSRDPQGQAREFSGVPRRGR